MAENETDNARWLVTASGEHIWVGGERRWNGPQQEPPKGLVLPNKIECELKQYPWGYNPMLYT